MLNVRWFVPVLVLMAALFIACGDDDDEDVLPTDGTENGTPTETVTATPDGESPTPAETEEPEDTPTETPPNELTEEIIEAARTYLQTSAEPQYDVTEPADCSAITDQIDAGEATIEDFIGENLVCLASAEFEDGNVRIGFGPYASEVIGVLLLEQTDEGGWVGTTIEPGPEPGG